jgi:hypothetical protein
MNPTERKERETAEYTGRLLVGGSRPAIKAYRRPKDETGYLFMN